MVITSLELNYYYYSLLFISVHSWLKLFVIRACICVVLCYCPLFLIQTDYSFSFDISYSYKLILVPSLMQNWTESVFLCTHMHVNTNTNIVTKEEPFRLTWKRHFFKKQYELLCCLLNIIPIQFDLAIWENVQLFCCIKPICHWL